MPDGLTAVESNFIEKTEEPVQRDPPLKIYLLFIYWDSCCPFSHSDLRMA